MPEIENVFEAARIGGCPRTPDGSDEEALEFLKGCIELGNELYKTAARERFSEEGVQELVFEYAEEAVPIYTSNLWYTWVQLAGWRNNSELYDREGFTVEDLEKIPQTDCYEWAANIIRYRAEY
tara:strand:+ start:1264 stop:1635 length:372 start_codon:yes stop_codon:yes gene_type:complete